MTKVLAFLVASLCVSYAAELTVPVGIEGNDSVTFIREDDGLGNYDAGYNENVLTGGASFHRERGLANGTRTGAYGYTTRNGLLRIVTYVADGAGFRADVLTNEPGVLPYAASDVTISKEPEPDRAALARVPTGYLDLGAASSAPVATAQDGPGPAEPRSAGGRAVERLSTGNVNREASISALVATAQDGPGHAGPRSAGGRAVSTANVNREAASSLVATAQDGPGLAELRSACGRAVERLSTGNANQEAAISDKSELGTDGQDGRGQGVTVRDYVVSSGRGAARYGQGHARVAVSSPFGGFQYVI